LEFASPSLETFFKSNILVYLSLALQKLSTVMCLRDNASNKKTLNEKLHSMNHALLLVRNSFDQKIKDTSITKNKVGQFKKKIEKPIH